MPHHALPAIKNLDLLSGEQEIQVVLDEYCNKLWFNAQLNQLEICIFNDYGYRALEFINSAVISYSFVRKKEYSIRSISAHLH